MRVLLLVHGFNSLSQRLFVELRDAGHDVSVEFDVNEAVLAEGVRLFSPDVIVAPFLKRAIPASIWRNHLCLIVHPGIVGDRGPSALDWAVLNGEPQWGVTVLQAEAEMDGGPIWASATFAMREATKSSLYRNEVTDAAATAVLSALGRMEDPDFSPARSDRGGTWRPQMTQADRRIDWNADDTATVLRKIRSADGMPGVRDGVAGRTVFLHDAREAPGFSGRSGEFLAISGPAVCRATRDGAVWIGYARAPASEAPFKLPASRVLAAEAAGLPEVAVDSDRGYREIRYEERGKAGFLHFDFYNGAMGIERCQRLLAAYRQAVARPTELIVLMGGADFWSNGMDLNEIEAADSPAQASLDNINAIDDLAEEIILTESHLTVAALCGNAGAGGVFLARAADRVWLRDGIVLNPHYKDMGNLFGSEFWTYLLPRHAGSENAKRIIEARLPISAREATELGLADDLLPADRDDFASTVGERAARLCDTAMSEALAEKCQRRARDETVKPLSAYREDELTHMRKNFYGFDPSYHVARYNFVRKVVKSRTPVSLAMHRDRGTSRDTMKLRNAS